MNDRQCPDLVMAHEPHGFERGSLGSHRNRISDHNLSDGNSGSFTRGTVSRQKPEHIAVAHESDEAVLAILNQHVPQPLPIHQRRHQLNQFILVHRKQIGKHELFDGRMADARLNGRFTDVGNLPLVNGTPLLLAFDHGGGYGAQSLSLASFAAHAVIGGQLPLATCLTRSNTVLDDSKVPAYIRFIDS